MKKNIVRSSLRSTLKIAAPGLLGLMLINSAEAGWFQAYNGGDWDTVTWGSYLGGTGTGASYVESDGSVYIDQGPTVFLTHDQTIGSLTVQRGAVKTGTLDLNTASTTLTVAGTATIGSLGNSALGTLDISGGSISVGGATTFNTNGVLNISDGSFSGAGTTMNGLMTISGGAMTDTGTSLFGSVSTVNFDFGGLDGSLMSSWDAADYTITSGAQLNLLGLSSVGTGTYDLVTYSGTRTGDYDGSYSVTGLGAGLVGTVEYDADSMYLNVAAVPEPSSAALLGLGGLALILRRRK